MKSIWLFRFLSNMGCFFGRLFSSNAFVDSFADGIDLSLFCFCTYSSATRSSLGYFFGILDSTTPCLLEDSINFVIFFKCSKSFFKALESSKKLTSEST